MKQYSDTTEIEKAEERLRRAERTFYLTDADVERIRESMKI